jgi:hypothetical protein
MSRASFFYICMLLTAGPVHADVITDFHGEPADTSLVPQGDLEAFFEFHIDPAVRDFGSKAQGEFPRKLGVECGVLSDTAPVAQWIARPPPKGQVAGSIPARGTKFPYAQTLSKPASR